MPKQTWKTNLVPKFNIGDTVSFNNDFDHNPAYKVISIGIIIAINITTGSGMFVGENCKGQIKYEVTGSSLVNRLESDFTLVRAANQ